MIHLLFNIFLICFVSHASKIHVPLYSKNYVVYAVNVNIGSPPQEFSLIVDTGSSDMAIPFKDNISSSTIDRNCSFNSNCKCLQNQCSVQNIYGSGTYKGYQGLVQNDVMSFISLPLPKNNINFINIKEFIVDNLTNISYHDNIFLPYDGILGLGDNSISTFNNNYFIDDFLDENKTFTIDLIHNQLILNDKIDKDLQSFSNNYTHNLKNKYFFMYYTEPFYNVPLRFINVYNYKLIIPNHIFTILDSGTSMMVVPYTFYNALWKIIHINMCTTPISKTHNNYYNYPCCHTQHVNNPEIYFAFQDEYNNIIELNYPLLFFRYSKKQICMRMTPTNDSLFIIDINFFKQRKTVFDLKNKKIGINPNHLIYYPPELTIIYTLLIITIIILSSYCVYRIIIKYFRSTPHPRVGDYYRL